MTAQDLLAPPAAPPHPGSGSPQPRRRNRLRWVAGGAVLAAAVYGVAWHSPLTLVSELEVDTPKGIPAKAVRTASGITQATHLPAVDPSAVELAIMSALPEVAAVSVTRQLPDRVVLTVSAREPIAAVAVKRGYVLIDADGVLFDRVNRAKGLPIMDAASDDGRAAAVAVLNSLPEKLRAKVASIKASTRDDVTMKFRDSALVRWGSPSDPQLKAQVLAALVGVEAKEYDVSAPMLPTTSGSVASPSPTP